MEANCSISYQPHRNREVARTIPHRIPPQVSPCTQSRPGQFGNAALPDITPVSTVHGRPQSLANTLVQQAKKILAAHNSAARILNAETRGKRHGQSSALGQHDARLLPIPGGGGNALIP